MELGRSFINANTGFQPWQPVTAPLIHLCLFLNTKLSLRETGYASDSNWLTLSCMDFTLGTRPSIWVESIRHQAKHKRWIILLMEENWIWIKVKKVQSKNFYTRVVLDEWRQVFQMRRGVIFCRQTRWSHSRWRHSSTSPQTQNGLLYQTPENKPERNCIIT